MEKVDKKPELVCPAGDWTSMITAAESGADSIYFGVKGINMRANAANFELSELNKVMDHLHKHGKKGYLALNVIVMNTELEKVKKILIQARSAGVDAVILWDLAVMSYARDLGLPVHLSTQASVANARALAAYAAMGVKRAVLARECTLKQISEIVTTIGKENINCEVETFVHGAMCVSISGRCFLSGSTFEKSANRGQCMQPCRREFEIRDLDGDSDYILGKDYILSPKDLCTIEFIDELIKTRAHSFKIEGRMRSKEYIREVISCYRQAIDSYFQGELTREQKNKLKQRLASVYNRGFSTGFYFGRPVDWISRKLEQKNEKLYLGEVVKFYKKIGVAEIIVRSNKVKLQDRIMIVGKNTPARFTEVTELQQHHKVVTLVEKGEAAGVKLPFSVKSGDQIFLWREKSGS